MRVQSTAESTLIEDGVWWIAFEFSGTEPGYLLISYPDGAGAAAEFFGHDHYVEVNDQAFGCYGGVTSLKIKRDNELEIGLSYEVAGVGTHLTVTTKAPLPTETLSRLRALER